MKFQGSMTCLRHLRIVFKLSDLDKTYRKCLQNKITETIANTLITTSNSHLIKKSTSDISKKYFKVVFKTNFQKNLLLLFTYFDSFYLNVAFLSLFTKSFQC